jgi:hypothetical protein
VSLPGGGTWTYGYLQGNSTYFEILGKDDPNAVAPMLATITDDQGRQVEYHLDLLGAPHEVVTDQLYDGGLNRVNFLDTLYTYDQNQAGSLSHRRVQTLANIWASKDQNGQWQYSNLVQNDYTYDLGGERLTNTITSADGTNRTEQYSYDELNRLKTVGYGDGQTQGYSFDAMGNRVQKTDTVNGTEGYTFNAANMLLSRAGNVYTNDLDGNTLTGGPAPIQTGRPPRRVTLYSPKFETPPSSEARRMTASCCAAQGRTTIAPWPTWRQWAVAQSLAARRRWWRR